VQIIHSAREHYIGAAALDYRRAPQSQEPASSIFSVAPAEAAVEMMMGRGLQARGHPVTPLAAVAAGLLAGAVGTASMDAVRYVRHRRANGTEGPLAWEFAPIPRLQSVGRGETEQVSLLLGAVTRCRL